MFTRKLCLEQILQVRKNEQRSDRFAYARYRLKMIPAGILRFLPALVLCALLLPSCGSDIKPTEAPWTPGVGSAPDAAEIFPLAVGNKWIYDYTWGSDSVTATVMIDDKEYYVMRGSSLIVAGVPAYVRMNDQEQLLVRRQRKPETEHVLFDFGAKPGSQWVYLPPFADTLNYGTVTLVSRSDSTTVPAGDFKDCYLFHFKSASMTDSDWGWLIAPGTGIVHFGGGLGFEYKLVKFVEGKQ
jgi:hypothetical protein